MSKAKIGHELEKTTVGHDLAKLFGSDLMPNIISFIDLSPEEKKNREAYEKHTHWYYHSPPAPLDKYEKVLRFDPKGIYYKGEQVMKLDWSHRCMKWIRSKREKCPRKIREFAVKDSEDTWNFEFNNKHKYLL